MEFHQITILLNEIQSIPLIGMIERKNEALMLWSASVDSFELTHLAVP
jgi:hypothetical protein